jgi:hypothetical protein
MIARSNLLLLLRSRFFARCRRALHHAPRITHNALVCGLLVGLLPTRSFADSPKKEARGGIEITNALGDAVVLIIRHAEKPDKGVTLSPEGRQRAEAYVHYFQHFAVDGQPLGLDYLVATADSSGSERPRLTLEPLGKALGLKIDQRFKSKQCEELAEDLRAHPRGKHILICWHHGKIPQLVTALGADAEQLLPGGKWPDDQFGWVLELHYDRHGQLIPREAKRIEEHLETGAANAQAKQ